MGLRTKLKNIIKQKLGRESTKKPTPTVQYPPPQPVQAKVQTPVVEVHTPDPEASTPVAAPQPEVEASEQEDITELKGEQTETAPTETSPEESIEPAQNEDESGACAVYEIKHLFPETCPNCNTPTYGNWKYIGSGFACEKCGTAF